jgi:ankyrin repeat protein
MDHLLYEACKIGDLPAVKNMVSQDVDIRANKDGAFLCACGEGHLHVVSYLVSLGGVDTHACDDFAFRWSCKNGHLHVAQYLVSLGGVDIHVYDDRAFLLACVNGHHHVAQYLVYITEKPIPDPEYITQRNILKTKLLAINLYVGCDDLRREIISYLGLV